MRMIGNMLGVDDAKDQEKQDDETKGSSNIQVDSTDVENDRQNQSYVHEDEENQEEIDFDHLLEDAALTQLDYDEDRDDYDFDETDDNSNHDSFALSNTDQGALQQAVGNALSDAA